MPSQIVLLHSALGLRPGVDWFADRLRAAGHIVHTPDLFGGEVFDSLEAGLAKRDELGMDEVLRRGRAAVEPLGAELVYAGFSLGDVDDARELRGELFLYPGSGHLFADPDLPDYDEAATELVIERTLVFLS